MAIPKTVAGKVDWLHNFATVIARSPEAAGLTAEQVDLFTSLDTSLQTTWALSENEATRTKITIHNRDLALRAALTSARKLVSIVKGADVTDALKIELGITLPSNPTPKPAPETAPFIQVVSISGRTVKLQLRTTQAQRGKPANVTGASVFLHIGPNPPGPDTPWSFAANVTKTNVTLPFTPSETGDTAWLSAFWSNAKGQSGPACQPVKIYLPAADSVPKEMEEAA